MHEQAEVTATVEDTEQAPTPMTATPAPHAAAAEERTAISEDDMKKLLQSEADRRVSAALTTQEKKLRAEFASELTEREAELEAARLKEQGRYQELFERTQQELEALKAEGAAKEFRNQATAALLAQGVPEFSEILLSGRDTVDDVTHSARALAGLIERKVETLVAQRLHTGTPVRTAPPKPPKNLSEMSPEEFALWKRTNGISD